MVEIVGIPIVFEVVDLPVGPLACVGLDEGVGAVAVHLLAVLPVVAAGFLVAEILVVVAVLDPLVLAVGVVGVRSDVRGVGSDPGRGVDAGLDGVVAAAAPALPAVVDVDVRPAVVHEPRLDHRTSRGEDLLLRDVARPAVPRVPAHGRREGDPLADDDAKFAGGFPECVACGEFDEVGARLLDAARDEAGRGIEGEAFGQTFGGECHGSVSGCRYGEEKLRAGTGPEDLRPVDAGSRRRGRGENVLREIRHQGVGGRLAPCGCPQKRGREEKRE